MNCKGRGYEPRSSWERDNVEPRCTYCAYGIQAGKQCGKFVGNYARGTSARRRSDAQMYYKGSGVYEREGE